MIFNEIKVKEITLEKIKIPLEKYIEKDYLNAKEAVQCNLLPEQLKSFHRMHVKYKNRQSAAQNRMKNGESDRNGWAIGCHKRNSNVNNCHTTGA